MAKEIKGKTFDQIINDLQTRQGPPRPLTAEQQKEMNEAIVELSKMGGFSAFHVPVNPKDE